MVSDRVTVSLDEDARTALDNLVTRTGQGQSEFVRRALTFYAANFRTADSDLPFDLEIEEGVSKVLITEIREE